MLAPNIRINGAIVGGLAGLVLHALARAFGGRRRARKGWIRRLRLFVTIST